MGPNSMPWWLNVVVHACDDFSFCHHRGNEDADTDASEPGLHAGEHVSAEARFAAAASQLRGRDKLDREQLRDLRRQMRAEKKVRPHQNGLGPYCCLASITVHALQPGRCCSNEEGICNNCARQQGSFTYCMRHQGFCNRLAP